VNKLISKKKGKTKEAGVGLGKEGKVKRGLDKEQKRSNKNQEKQQNGVEVFRRKKKGIGEWGFWLKPKEIVFRKF